MKRQRKCQVGMIAEMDGSDVSIAMAKQIYHPRASL